MVFDIYKDGQKVNSIVCDEKFVATYCQKNGFSFKAGDAGLASSPPPAKQREEAYNTQAVIPWEGEELTVTQAAQKWQYYAAAGDMEKATAITSLIAETKKEIRTQWPD